MATAKGGTPFPLGAANDWTLPSDTNDNGSGGHRISNGNDAPEVTILDEMGTTVTAPKPLLPDHTWHAVLKTNSTTSVFSAIEEVRHANFQDYKDQ